MRSLYRHRSVPVDKNSEGARRLGMKLLLQFPTTKDALAFVSTALHLSTQHLSVQWNPVRQQGGVSPAAATDPPSSHLFESTGHLPRVTGISCPSPTDGRPPFWVSMDAAAADKLTVLVVGGVAKGLPFAPVVQQALKALPGHEKIKLQPPWSHGQDPVALGYAVEVNGVPRVTASTFLESCKTLRIAMDYFLDRGAGKTFCTSIVKATKFMVRGGQSGAAAPAEGDTALGRDLNLVNSNIWLRDALFTATRHPLDQRLYAKPTGILKGVQTHALPLPFDKVNPAWMLFIRGELADGSSSHGTAFSNLPEGGDTDGRSSYTASALGAPRQRVPRSKQRAKRGRNSALCSSPSALGADLAAGLGAGTSTGPMVRRVVRAARREGVEARSFSVEAAAQACAAADIGSCEVGSDDDSPSLTRSTGSSARSLAGSRSVDTAPHRRSTQGAGRSLDAMGGVLERSVAPLVESVDRVCTAMLQPQRVEVALDSATQATLRGLAGGLGGGGTPTQAVTPAGNTSAGQDQQILSILTEIKSQIHALNTRMDEVEGSTK